MSALRSAVIGAGPVGLEMALTASDLGFDVHVFEAGRVGEHLSWFRGVTLFTPFWMNSTERTRERLRRVGGTLPADDGLLTAGDLMERYLAPIALLPELVGRIHEGCRVLSVARVGTVKSGPGGAVRAQTPFVLCVEEKGASRFVEADLVIDASGVVGRPRSFGPGGLEAQGESTLGDRVDRHLPPTREAMRALYSGKQALLVGSGHSAATALIEFDALASAGAGPSRVHWVCRKPSFAARPDDPLPARAELGSAANHVAANAPWIQCHPGAVIEAAEAAADGAIDVTLTGQGEGLAPVRVRVDRILSLTGYRPNTDLSRELQIHMCYASEAPMALAAALTSATAANPEVAGDCLSQATHGPETLRTTEPGFFVIGAKSYGRNPSFLVRLGYD
ncbi:MAG TPA: FAD-dependent oxidoreductase, partial [Candidatus Eisenbacteria bacterium]|nr:FAD-dependent oxidoreductase [Candidatus Eisenbacteria bacterium]